MIERFAGDDIDEASGFDRCEIRFRGVSGDLDGEKKQNGSGKHAAINGRAWGHEAVGAVEFEEFRFVGDAAVSCRILE